jgi:hypothetical protein
MKIRYISLHIEHPLYSGFPDEAFNLKFNKNARFICNYLSKAVRKLNLETDGTYKMISVHPHAIQNSSKMYYVDYALSNAIYVSSKEMERYTQMINLTERYEFYLSLLERGYMQAVTFKKEVPVEALLSLHQQFRDGGYKNEWLFKKKQIRDFGIYIYLNCYFTSFDFRLELEAYSLKTKELVSKGVVMQTPPNEVCFDYKFKQITLEDNKLVILDFLGHPRYEMDLHKLSKGNFNVKYLDINDIKDIEPDQKKIQSITW